MRDPSQKTCDIRDCYLAAYVEIITGVEPEPKDFEGQIVFQFPNVDAAYEAIRSYHSGGRVEAERMTKVVRENFFSIRSHRENGETR